MLRPKEMAGFTLIELMIVVALLVIFATIALPSFSYLIKTNRTQSAASELASLLQYARAEAVTRNVDITAAASSGAWTVSQGNTVLRQLDSQQSTLSILPATASVTFYPNGTASANTNIYICNDGDAATGYQLTVSVAGQVRLWPRGTSDAGEALGSCGS